MIVFDVFLSNALAFAAVGAALDGALGVAVAEAVMWAAHLVASGLVQYRAALRDDVP